MRGDYTGMIRSFIFDYDCSQTGICKTNELIAKLQSQLGMQLENKEQVGCVEIVHEPNFHIIKIDFDKVSAPKPEIIRRIIFDTLAEVTEIPKEKQSFFDKVRSFFSL